MSKPKAGLGPLILASQSPRRRHLLQQAGYDFEVISPHESAECGVSRSETGHSKGQETPPEMAARLARQKAADVALRTESGIVIGCDTIVECTGVVMGKPRHLDDARQMLQRLSGRRHTVYSGLCLWRRPDDSVDVRVASSILQMDELSGDQLNEYLLSLEWEGKAGGFGYQDRHDWIHLIDGSESNVVGLPMELLAEMLARYNTP